MLALLSKTELLSVTALIATRNTTRITTIYLKKAVFSCGPTKNGYISVPRMTI